ncbi:MAG: 3-hydroxyacyl-CoA dehydrogenase NAD-binding domain-containing protein [Candidatus Eremiobacteraeota bacterium]|nr:3-hydroxyacyl-CoA dehydrogenase NAD-binding domain-containing protein [Candidatus Eremiobacteraeota bacterium]
MLHTADRGTVRILMLDNPPVNALSFAFCSELLAAVQAAEADANVNAIVFTGANGIFSGGADVNDFLTELRPDAITIRDVIAAIERGGKTYVAAIDGNALGGGLELSLACDYRVAGKRSKLGLPEIKLGLLPGAGGTQRLPRLIGAQAALEMMLKGESVSAEAAKKSGIIDEVVEADVVDGAVAFAQRVVADRPKRRLSALTAQIGSGITPLALPFVVSQAHKMVPPEGNGGFAAHKLIDAVEAALELPFEHGIARESRLFEELVRSEPSLALRHIFFAERELAKIPGLPKAEPKTISKAAVIGGGTMGTGIAITFANAGIPVTVVEPADEAIERGKQMVFGMFMHQVQRGRMTQEEAWKRGQSVVFTSDYSEISDVDLVIEAVFENMDVKKQVFAKLEAIVKPDAIFASNTSTLDIDEMAAVTKRPEQFVGLHFFAPANIMKLLEIVRGSQTSPQTLATAMKLGKLLRKIAVLSANAFGFIGNRMLFDYAREAVGLAEAGISPHRIDKAMKAFGFPMGPFAMFDLSGVDVFWHIQQARPDMGSARSKIIDRMYELKRLGQKTGAGFHKYEKGKRDPIADPQIEVLFAEEAAKAGISPRSVTDDEIVKRLVYALINAGANLLGDGVALRPGDIDIVYVYGYGFPPHHGGPMWYADEVGVKNVYDAVLGFGWEPSPLLAQIAASDGKFASYSKELVHA